MYRWWRIVKVRLAEWLCSAALAVAAFRIRRSGTKPLFLAIVLVIVTVGPPGCSASAPGRRVGIGEPADIGCRSAGGDDWNIDYPNAVVGIVCQNDSVTVINRSGCVRVLHSATSVHIGENDPRRSSIVCAQITKSGIIALDAEGIVHRFSVPGLGGPKLVREEVARGVVQIAGHRESTRVCICFRDGYMEIRDLATDQSLTAPTWRNTQTDCNCVSVAMCGDGQTAAVSCIDGRVLVWRVGQPPIALKTKADGVPAAIALSMDGRYMAVAAGKEVLFWNLSTATLLWRQESTTEYWQHVAIGIEDRQPTIWLASNTDVQLRDVSGSLVKNWTSVANGITCMDVSTTNDAVILGDVAGNVVRVGECGAMRYSIEWERENLAGKK